MITARRQVATISSRSCAAITRVPGNPWMTMGLRSVFGVAAPEEIVKVLVIVAVLSVFYVRKMVKIGDVE